MFGRSQLNEVEFSSTEFIILCLRHLHPDATIKKYRLHIGEGVPHFRKHEVFPSYTSRDKLARRYCRNEFFDSLVEIQTQQHKYRIEVKGEVFNDVGIWEPRYLWLLDREFAYYFTFTWSIDRGFKVKDAIFDN